MLSQRRMKRLLRRLDNMAGDLGEEGIVGLRGDNDGVRVS
jgi:hypothetical protein